MVAAVVLPFYDPVRLAEDMAVLDIISRGRVSYVLGIGHREEEYDLFGIDSSARGLADEHLATLLELLAGDGGSRRRAHPRDARCGPAAVLSVGGSLAAARRAARHGLGLIAQADRRACGSSTRRIAARTGTSPASPSSPPRAPRRPSSSPTTSSRVGRARPHLLHDAMTAGVLSPRRDGRRQHQPATTVDELRAEPAPTASSPWTKRPTCAPVHPAPAAALRWAGARGGVAVPWNERGGSPHRPNEERTR